VTLKEIESQPAVTDLKVISKEETCPENYANIFINSWPGTYEGCRSPSGNTDVYRTDDFVQICNEFAGDKLFPSNTKKKYKIWRNA
jgi:hypothetical protein